MKRVLFLMVVLCIAMGIATTANASLYWYEDFNYPTLGELTVNSFGNWSSHSGSGTGIQIINTQSDVSSSLAYIGISTSVNAGSNRVQMGGSNAPDEHREIVPNVFRNTLVAPVNLYASFLTKFTTAPTGQTYFAHFIENNGSSIFDGRIVSNTTTGGNIAFGMFWSSAVGSITTFSANIEPPNQTILLVEKLTIVPDTTVAADSASLWVNPSAGSFGGSEPAPDVQVACGAVSGDVGAGGITSFALREAGVSQGVEEVDDIRIGTTWADVTPTTGAYTPVELSHFSATDTKK